MCLCGVMAAEYETLPAQMQDAVIRFFDESETRLAGVLKQGRESGTLDFVGSPREVALLIISGLEGAMLVNDPLETSTAFKSSQIAYLPA